eukprot:Blabericola_migrator_1__12516@NODE_792_length_6486_cov_25_403022_g561_i0_p3_GENE_NODE_792_length_6486_cov_25_403022_g561_i0NODE_792_length_6486_cov_25_403022_g561_i0_p3_ORF_typecomplete_len141_score13_12_NODE_792_length_6486_cov_25_403022_g561_i012201642
MSQMSLNCYSAKLAKSSASLNWTADAQLAHCCNAIISSDCKEDRVWVPLHFIYLLRELSSHLPRANAMKTSILCVNGAGLAVGEAPQHCRRLDSSSRKHNVCSRFVMFKVQTLLMFTKCFECNLLYFPDDDSVQISRLAA